LKDAAIWLGEREIDYWQDWLNPPVEFVCWIQEGFQNVGETTVHGESLTLY
jgi:hypothetical protein